MIAVLVCLILAWVVVDDLRHFRVRNLSVAALALCFPLDCLVRGRVVLLAPHMVFAGVGLAVVAGVFLMRMMGGGDAKLLSAALLWVGPEGCFVFALALFGWTLVYATGAKLEGLPSRWAQGRRVIPFGPSIAAAWMTQIGLARWL